MYRREVLSSLRSKNYTNCFGALAALNALLPVKYRVRISTMEYEKLTKSDIMYNCNFCEVPTNKENIRIQNIMPMKINRLFESDEFIKIWECPSCTKENRLDKTRVTKTILQEPYFLKVVPAMPQRKNGLMGRNQFDSEASRYIWNLLDEIEERMAQFRDDNWHKGDEMYDLDDSEIDTGDDFA